MRYTTTVLFSTLFLASSALSLQTPQTPNASIQGTVTRSDTGAPVVGAQVTLSILNPLAAAVQAGADVATLQALQAAQPTALTQPAQIPPVTTDSEGKFSFTNLNAGTYNIFATANGFVRQQYGQRSLNGQGVPFTLAANQAMKDMALRLPPTGTISGRILDENGQPAMGIPVQLLRQMYNPNGKVYQAVASTGADDRGQYRMFGVTPGRYYLSIGNPPGPPRIVTTGGVISQPGNVAYALSYFPGVADVNQSVLVEVQSAQEAVFDMTTKRQQMYRVRGTLLDSRTGQPPAGNVQVMLGYRAPTGGSGSFSSGRNYDPATGRFELLNVIPGQYVVQAQIQEPITAAVSNVQQLEERQAQQAMQPMGRTPITVANGDVEGVAVVLTTAVPLPGKVSVEGQALEAVTGIDRMRVTVRASTDSIAAGNQPAPGVVRADGTFQIVGLREGEFMVQAGALPVGFYVKSINYGGSDVLNAPFKFSGSASGTMDVVLRSGLGRITGVVSDARSQGVARVLAVLIPQQRDRSDLYRTSTTDQTGQFNFANVVPGSYRIFSWEAFEQGMQYDPDLLKKHEQQGRVVQVTESTEQKVDLRMIPMN